MEGRSRISSISIGLEVCVCVQQILISVFKITQTYLNSLSVKSRRILHLRNIYIKILKVFFFVGSLLHQSISRVSVFQKPGDVFCSQVIMTTLVIRYHTRAIVATTIVKSLGVSFFFSWVAQTFRVQNLGVSWLVTPAS